MLQFQSGDESSFEYLVNRHKQQIFNLAYRFLGNYQDAEDAAQELFMKVYTSAKTYQPIAKFTTWTYKICKNVCLKKLQKRKIKSISLSDYNRYSDDSAPMQIKDANSELPVETLLAQEQIAMVKKAINSLPERQKFAVLLYRYQKCSYEDVSYIMDCSVEAVKSTLHRARMNLKDKLKNYLEKMVKP